MWRAGPSAPCRKGICEAEKICSTCKKTGTLYQRLTRFQVATERCRNSRESAIRCRFLPPSGQPKGYRSCSLQTATCPQNNRQPMNSLETDRFEHVDIIMIKPYCISHCIMLIVTFFGYFWYGDSLHDFLKTSRFECACKQHPKTHVLHPCRKPNPPLSGCDISDLTGIPGLPPPPGKFSHQYSSPS